MIQYFCFDFLDGWRDPFCRETVFKEDFSVRMGSAICRA